MSLYASLQKRRLILPILVGFVLCLGVILHFILASPPPRISAPASGANKASSKPRPISYVVPARLKSPAISVDAPIDRVSLTSKGSLAAPTGPASAGWFALGPRPGELGNAVIDGHFGWVNNIPAVFDNLSKLKAGDSLYVEDEKGKSITFVVRQVRAYGQNENDSAVFNSSDGKAHLNLITCEGVWSETQQSYSGRLVVFADKSN